MSNLPQIQAEDKPPLLRFASLAVEDKILSEETGCTEYKDVVKVYVRAAGDTKCEVPFIAKDIQYLTKTKVMDVNTEVTRRVRDPKTGEMIDVQEPVTERREEEVYDRKTIYPWLDQLKQKLTSGYITPEYYEYCKRAFERFMANEAEPINGVPLSEWRGCSESLKKKAIDIGVTSVELAAEMTEEAMQAIGIGAQELKRKANAWLEADKSPGKAAAKMLSLSEENKSLMERLATLERALKQTEDKPKNKGGRPPKVQPESEAA